MIDIIEICKNVLVRLANMASEKDGGNSNEQLIFPIKIQAEGTKIIKRISEQELRLLFIEEFIKKHRNLYYSVETPTTGKFYFGKTYDTIKIENEGQSASHDMCIFDKISGNYKRIMNIEFKYRNSGIKNTGKDILKLMREEQSGVFILLLENTNSNTLFSVFKKLSQSFYNFKTTWVYENKSIQLVILSLEQKKFIHCKLRKQDLSNMNDFFKVEEKSGNINNFENIHWKIEQI
jgi:hypothetical protein